MKVAFDFENKTVTAWQEEDGREATVSYDEYFAAVEHVRVDQVFKADVSCLFDERVGQLIFDTTEHEAEEALRAAAGFAGPPTTTADSPVSFAN